MPRMIVPKWLWITSILGFLVASVLPAAAGISVSIQPDTTIIDPLETFTVYTWIDSSGSEFSGYEAVVRFDPFAIEFVSVREESLMTDVCNNTWWQTEVGDSTVFISHVLLCGGETITGPGAVSAITFQARENEMITTISYDYIEFYRGGNPVEDVVWHDGTVIIGASSGLEEEGIDPDSGLRLEIFPNPGPASVLIRFDLPQPGPASVSVFDCLGRRIAQPLRERFLRGGRHEVRWTPPVRQGAAARGVYFCQLRAGSAVLSRRVTVTD